MCIKIVISTFVIVIDLKKANINKSSYQSYLKSIELDSMHLEKMQL